MNALVTETPEGYVAYWITEEDKEFIGKTELIRTLGTVDDIVMHNMCVMQLVEAVTLPPEKRVSGNESEIFLETYSDSPVCASEVLAEYMIELNDNDTTWDERQQLKELVEVVMNTCPVKRKYLKNSIRDERRRPPAYRAAERQREKMIESIPTKAAFEEKLQVIREAANLFRTDAEVVRPQS